MNHAVNTELVSRVQKVSEPIRQSFSSYMDYQEFWDYIEWAPAFESLPDWVQARIVWAEEEVKHSTLTL